MKNLFMLGGFALAVLWGVLQISPGSSFESVFFQAEAAAIQAPITPTFTRGITVEQGQPCDDERGGVDYKSEIVSREEMTSEIVSVGFTGERIEQMLAISLAEGGRQISCIADEHLTNDKWDISYGVYSIRALKADRGTGSCRDLDRLYNNLHEQTVCAWEISGNGHSLQPWSTYTNGKWKQYVGK